MDEDERGDAIRGIPKLRLLVILEYYLRVPWASPILGSCHSLFHSPSNLYPKLENFTTQNLTENLMSSVSERKQNTTSRYCNELIVYLYWCNIYCIPTSLWFIPSDTTHRFIKISKQHLENRICQNRTVCSNLYQTYTSGTPKILPH